MLWLGDPAAIRHLYLRLQNWPCEIDMPREIGREMTREREEGRAGRLQVKHVV